MIQLIIALIGFGRAKGQGLRFKPDVSTNFPSHQCKTLPYVQKKKCAFALATTKSRQKRVEKKSYAFVCWGILSHTSYIYENNLDKILQQVSIFDIKLMMKHSVIDIGLNFLQNEFSQIYLSPEKLSKVFTFQSCKWCHFVILLSFASKYIFLSLRKIT